MRGIIDRIEDGVAIIVTSDNKELALAMNLLPENATEGTALSIQTTSSQTYDIRIDEEETSNRKERIASLREQILQKQRRK